MSTIASAEDNRANQAEAKNRLSKNISSNMVAKVLYMASRLCLPPITLSYISMEEYGIWATCFIIIGYLGVSSFGISSVYVRYVAEYHALDQPDKISRLLSTGLCASIGLSAAALTVLWFALPHIIGGLSISADLQDMAFVLIFASAATFMLDLSLGAFAYVLHGLQRISQQNAVWVISFILEAILIVFLLVQGWGVYGLLTAFIARYLLATALNYILCRRALPDLKLSPSLFDRDMLKIFYGYGATVQLSGLLSTFLYSIEKVLAGSFIGVHATGLFDIGQKLPMMTSQIFGSMNTALLPAMARLNTLKQNAQIAQLYLKGMRYMNMITGAAMAFLAAFASPLLYLWIGPHESHANLAIILSAFCLPFQLHILTGPASMYHRAVDNPKREFVYKFIQLGLVALTVSVGFFSWGINNEVIVWSVAISMSLSALTYIAYSNRFISVTIASFARTVLWPGTFPYLIAAALSLLSQVFWDAEHSTRLPLFAILLMLATVYVFLVATMLYFTSCDSREKEAIKNAIRAGRNRAQNLLPRFGTLPIVIKKG